MGRWRAESLFGSLEEKARAFCASGLKQANKEPKDDEPYSTCEGPTTRQRRELENGPL